MRPAISVAFLLLLLLFITAQGIRLKGELSSTFHFQRKLQEEKRSPTGGQTRLCIEGGQCSGKSRKLITAATAGHESTRSEGMERGGSQRFRPKEQIVGFPARPAVTMQRPFSPETSPDIIDIAGMDYSPPRRKPPIHN